MIQVTVYLLIFGDLYVYNLYAAVSITLINAPQTPVCMNAYEMRVCVCAGRNLLGLVSLTCLQIP